jgi:RNA polymerase sigma-70 factor, ECF subfamily
MMRKPDSSQTSPISGAKTDLILVEQTLAGDASAFDELVTRYRDRVYTLACHLLRNPHDAEDVAQEVFVRAYRSLRSFRRECAFFTWLYRIAVNLAYTHSRRRKRRRELEDAAASEPAAVWTPPQLSPAEQAEREEIRDQVHGVLPLLDDRLRQVLVLKEIEGLEVAAIAELLQIPVGTVKSRLFRGREDLRRLLDRQRSREKE